VRGSTSRDLLVFVGGVTLAVVAGLAAFYIVMRPSGDELLSMTVFLGVTAVVSVAAGYAAYRVGWFKRSPRLVWTLVGGYLLAVAIVFLNVAVTAGLMFINRHDLLLSAVLLLSAGLIAVSLGYLLSSAVADSIATLSGAVSEVAEGDLAVEVPVEGPDELAKLAAGFNEMTCRLREAEADRDAMEASRRDLIAAVGHDLRTPLASVRVIIEALADGLVEDPDTAERYLRTAQRDVGVLSRLIDDLFVLAQLDSAGIQLDLETNSLSDLVSDTLGSFAVRAERQGVRLEGESEARPDAIDFDALYVGRALSNLVDNALAHTPEGGVVRLETETVDEGVRIGVADTGPGVEPADMPHLFDRFYRGEASRSRATGGSGLGLAIVKAVAEAHGGEARVSSSDEGATFYFMLPSG
jgi:two-component system sensor histidine kinase BaeS